MAEIAIIGGTGLATLKNLEISRREVMRSPYGEPSGPLLHGELGNTDVVFLPRHGRGHRISPTELPVRANIYALKRLGVRRIIASSACGSLREDMAPRHIVIADQLYDRTRHRAPHTFFEGGIVAHIGFADPFCPALRQVLLDGARVAGHVGEILAGLVVDCRQCRLLYYRIRRNITMRLYRR